MGYRSQVSIGFNKAAFAKHVKQNIEHFKDCDSILQNKDSIIFSWDGVKWYPDYEDVQGIEEVIDRISEEEGDDELWGFLRIGEDDTDIESRGCPYNFEINLVRTIGLELEDSEPISPEEYFSPNSLKFIKD